MLTLTDVAVEKIKHLLKHKTYKGIRIGVRTTGCSGLAYTLEYIKEDKFTPYDDRIVYPDFIILVSLKDKVYLKGMVIDYKRNGLNEGFEFPEHDTAWNMIIHRTKEEVCLYAWYDAETDSWDILPLEDRLDSDSPMTEEDVMTILEGLAERYFKPLVDLKPGDVIQLRKDND